MRGSKDDGEDSKRARSRCICSCANAERLDVAAIEADPLEENLVAARSVTVAAAVVWYAGGNTPDEEDWTMPRPQPGPRPFPFGIIPRHL